jgi:hypothetical protein
MRNSGFTHYRHTLIERGTRIVRLLEKWRPEVLENDVAGIIVKSFNLIRPTGPKKSRLCFRRDGDVVIP